MHSHVSTPSRKTPRQNIKLNSKSIKSPIEVCVCVCSCHVAQENSKPLKFLADTAPIQKLLQLLTATLFHVSGTAESELPAKQSSGEEAQETAEGAATPATVETHDAPRENRLSSLLSGRRRANAVRRPGTLLPSTTKQSSQE